MQQGRRLLTSSYRDFHPCDLGDRYVAFLLKNECTERVLQQHVLMDHLAVIRKLCRTEDGGNCGGGILEEGLTTVDDGNNLDVSATTTAVHGVMNQVGAGGQQGGSHKKRGSGATGGSIEIDAFQLLSRDPVLGNLTLRYPDTLLELLEDSTVQARTVLRRRMEVALHSALQARKGEYEQQQDKRSKNDEARIKSETNNMTQLLKALRYTKEWYEPRPLHARLVHLPPHMQCCKPTLSSISSADVGTVVQICGTVVRTGPVRMMETMRTYMCLGKGCGVKFSVHADFGTTNNALPQPIVCPSSSSSEVGECNSTSFAIVPDGSEHTDYQEIKLQESASALNRVGSIPRSILIKLSDDLVDVCNPGDEVVVVGCLHAEWQNHSLGASVEVMVGMSMRAHSVRVINVEEGSAGKGGGGGVDGAMADFALLGGSGNLREKFRREFDAFWSDDGATRHPIATRDYIVRAVCPKLYGMHAVKLGLLLVLIGGALVTNSSREGNVFGASEEHQCEDLHDQSEAPMAFIIGGSDDCGYIKDSKKKRGAGGQPKTAKGNEKTVKRRVQSHILLLGDPGTGKSQFLRFAAALSPRSVLTTGTGSSTAGLTCAAVRDQSTSGSNGSEFSLEAGALALADRGVCCIDEFGCMSKQDRTSIHEAMEQQTISVAKAGIVCKLNARATVVAVMNPTGGIYDETLTLEQNSRLGSALLSRFDLIFVMLDQAQKERDTNIATFLLQQSIIPGSGYERPLAIGACFNDDEIHGHWSMEKLRAYIATIREKFYPILTPEASELLEKHYALCRQQRNGQSLITVRFLESLIRLSQAHARLMYRNMVTLDDAVAVILLMECTAAASSGGMFGCGINDYQTDDSLRKNPIDTDFKNFDEADSLFEIEKQLLLRRYEGKHSNNYGVSPPTFDPYRKWDDFSQNDRYHRPSSALNSQGRNEQRDQWGRQMLSQVNSPTTQLSSQCDSSERMLETMSQAGIDYRKPSSNRVTFSQQIQSTFPDYQGDPSMTTSVHGNFGDPHGQHLPQVLERSQSDGLCLEANMRSITQHSSGKTRKKRRTPD